MTNDDETGKRDPVATQHEDRSEITGDMPTDMPDGGVYRRTLAVGAMGCRRRLPVRRAWTSNTPTMAGDITSRSPDGDGDLP